MDMISSMGDSTRSNASSNMDTYSTRKNLQAQSDSLKMEAGQVRRNADEIEALGIREANEEQLRGDIMISNAKAQQAFSGGGVSGDAGFERRAADIETRADTNALGRIFERDSEAQKMRLKAKLLDKERKTTNRNRKYATYAGVLNTDIGM
jgi:hypothetical protein